MSSETGLRRRHEPEPVPPATVRTSHTVALNASTDGKKKKPTKLSTGLVAWYRANQSLVFAGIAYMVFGLAWAFSKFYLVEPSVSDLYVLCTSGGSRIYTVDDAMPKVQCIGVNGTVIFERGLMYDIMKRWQAVHGMDVRPNIRFVGKNSIIVPGLSDSHAHILEYGASLVIPLNRARDPSEAVKFVKEFVQDTAEFKNNPEKIIEGWGWDHMSWEEKVWPTAAEFDKEPSLRNRKIVLQSKDGHALWVSPAVIETIGSLPADIEGGVYTRTTDGKPAGVFIDKTQEFVPRAKLTDNDLRRRFKAAVNYAHSKGLTSIHDAGFSPVSLAFFRREAANQSLPIRVYGMMYFDENNYWGDKVEKIVDQGRLTARSVKMFADGALRSGYAALHEPYSDNHHTHGVMRITPEILNDMVPRFFQDGWQVNIHAIGDRANGIVLDAFESALKDRDVEVLRPRLEHAQILTSQDISRIASLKLIASIQPTHAISDMSFAEARLGPERSKGIYAFRSIIDAGARVTLGSDAPVEEMDPLSGFYAAITRLSPEGDSPHGPDGWFPEQRLTREEALKGITINPAYASFTEKTLGSLEVGKRADFVVLDQDIMTIEPEWILSTSVEATVIDGRPVYGKV